MSRLIPLSQGQSAIVDDADFDFLSQWKWTAQRQADGRFYVMRRDARRLILMHRLLNGTPDGFVTDHIDGDGLNNQRANLRTATQAQNTMNRHGKRGGTSRFKGVWDDSKTAPHKPWRAAIRINGKLKYLGRFASEEAAGAAYAQAAANHFGEFSRTSKKEQVQ